MSEVPAIETVNLEAEFPSTEGGYRGMGEGGTIGAPTAIANGLADAFMPLDAEIFEPLMTPERLFRLIGKGAGSALCVFSASEPMAAGQTPQSAGFWDSLIAPQISLIA